MTKILFIIPPSVPLSFLRETSDPKTKGLFPSIPLGVLSLSAYISKFERDIKIKVLDFNINTLFNPDEYMVSGWEKFAVSNIQNTMKDEVPDIAALSVLFNSQVSYLKFLSEQLKKLWPDTMIIAGGGPPTNSYQQILEEAPYIDAIGIGEGEKILLALIQSKNKRLYIKQNDSWVTNDKLDQDFFPKRNLLENLDDIPDYDYDLVEYDQYQKISRYHGDNKSLQSISIMTSRGCPYLCNFCASHTLHGKKIRYHSPERVIENIKNLKHKRGVNVFLIEDDHFLLNKNRALTILHAIQDEDLILEFPNGLAVSSIDEEIVDALKKAGLRMATLAVESGSPRVLKEIIHKHFTDLSKVQKAVSILREKDIYIRAFFIIGFPGETMKEIHESINFMKTVGFNWVGIMIASPIAGSELYRYCNDNDLLLSDDMVDYHYAKSNIKLPHSTPQELEDLRYLINLDVNFVNNYDLHNNHPEIALVGFKDVINRVSNHAFAHYFASQAYQELGNTDLADFHSDRYFCIIKESSQWLIYAKKFNLPH